VSARPFSVNQKPTTPLKNIFRKYTHNKQWELQHLLTSTTSPESRRLMKQRKLKVSLSTSHHIASLHLSLKWNIKTQIIPR
jgi:hypothetical protein